jgi:drug/metabolite transporter (DMT)-like permease
MRPTLAPGTTPGTLAAVSPAAPTSSPGGGGGAAGEDRTAPADAPTPLGAGAAVLAVVAWGLGNTLIAAIPMSGLAVAFYRLAAGVLLYVPVLYLRGGRLTRRSFALGWRGGVAFGVHIATFFVAIRLTTVANAVTISALQPLVIMGFAAAMFGERIRALHVVAALVATAGVAMVTFGAAGTGTGSAAGDLVAVLALLSWAWYFIASKSARTHLDTFEYMTVMNVVAFAVVAPAALVAGDVLDPDAGLGVRTGLMILAVVLVPGSGHILMNWAHGHTTLLFTSLVTLALPVLSTLSAAVFLDQPIAALQGAGIVVVIAALAAVIVGDQRTPPDSTEPAP